MALPWETLAEAESGEGRLELRRRGHDDFLITVAGRVLMNSRARRSEEALGEQGCAPVRGRAGARILVGGLGMGLTLRAALETLGPDAEVTVAELNPVVARWCRGALGELNGRALEDPRVRLVLGDVAGCVANAAAPGGAPYDAILLDLYAGPHPRSHARDDPFYGSRALARSHAALTPGGVLAVWSESPDRAFGRRLRAAGFALRTSRPGRGGLRHGLHLATRLEE